MKCEPLQPELLDRIDAYWRAANYLSVGQIYLRDNPLLKRPLELSDVKAMLLGHWYLVQPGLPRKHISELVTWLARVWPIEVGLFLIPTGMISVFNGTIKDGWHGLLGWMWIACSVLTIGLCFVTKAALKEKEYSAVMAATGLLYLAILTAFGTDLVARAVLAG